MGAIDLVVQIEAPPSVASGLQRIGRGGHQVDAVSEGVIFPKFRGDLRRLRRGRAGDARRRGRGHPLSAQPARRRSRSRSSRWRRWTRGTSTSCSRAIRRAAPFAELSRAVVRRRARHAVGPLSRPTNSPSCGRASPGIASRGTRHRARRREARRDRQRRHDSRSRALRRVPRSARRPGAARVGELDEEMVFESRVGETFVLGASSWRIEEITHDRVLVSPAPGEPGKMPFWKGDRAGPAARARPRDRAADARPAARCRAAAAIERLTREHDLDRAGRREPPAVPRDQVAAARRRARRSARSSSSACRDELGDWRVCVLSPRGGRIHAPWAHGRRRRRSARKPASTSRRCGATTGSWCGFRMSDQPPDASLLLPDPDEVEGARRAAARVDGALRREVPRERGARRCCCRSAGPGMRAPLWQQRKRAADLLAVAARYGSFPVAARDLSRVPARLLRHAGAGRRRCADIRSRTHPRRRPSTRETPSPFAASLLFSYVASFLYDGDAPLAERRAQALSVDQAQLRELLGDAELRELLDATVDRRGRAPASASRPAYHAKSADAVHDMLLRLGDLSAAGARRQEHAWRRARRYAERSDRARAASLRAQVAGDTRYIAVEDAARYRDALGVPLPPGLPESLLAAGPDSARRSDPALRAHARAVHRGECAAASGSARQSRTPRSMRWVPAGRRRRRRVQARRHRTRMVRRRRASHAPAALARAAAPRGRAGRSGSARAASRGVAGRRPPRRGLDALLDAIEQLQGAPLPASILETEILPARVSGYRPGDLDLLMAAGEVVWVGVEPLGDRDGRLALYLTDHLHLLLPPGDAVDPPIAACGAHPRLSE